VIRNLLLANGIVFLLGTFLSGTTFGGAPLDDVLVQMFALWPLDSGEFGVWQLLSYQFLHGGFTHILFNMLALWMFGTQLAEIWGPRRFLAFYLICGITAGLAHLGINPLLNDLSVPTVGASGSIMGVLVAYGMTFPDRPVIMFPIFFPIPAKWFVIIYAGIDLVSGVTNSGDGVAHFAHLGGAVGGFLLIKFGGGLLDRLENIGGSRRVGGRANVIDVSFRDIPPTSFTYVTTPTPPPAPKQRTPTKFVVNGVPVTQEEIDEILDKISVGGYHSLSEREKQLLAEVSKQL
jgi:membrane associated rhomboid family serine protease